MTPGEAIVTVEVPSPKRTILGISVGRPAVPEIKPGMHLYISTQQTDGSREFRRVLEDGPENSALSLVGSHFFHVQVGSFPFNPIFSRVVTDKQGNGWDCRICGQLTVSDSRRLLTSIAASNTSPSTPLTPGMAESWIAHRVASQVRDVVREYSIADLRDRNALPPSWWEKQLVGWLAEFGVTIGVDDVSWSSAQAEAAELEAARARDLERVEQASKRQQEAELREFTAAAQYEDQKKQIESDGALSDQERGHQLQLLEKRHRKELIEADTCIESARMEAEKVALEHEAMLARLQEDDAAVEAAEERGQKAEERHQAVVEELDQLNSTLTKLADLPENLLAQLADQDSQRANAAAERVVSPEFGIPASALADLGFSVERQNLVEALRKKAAAEGEKVSVRKTELVTRDLGTARVKGLPINTSLQFEFSTERGGHVTLLNIGTSGAVFVHVPNAHVTLDRAIVEGGRSYNIPGTELLPWEGLQQQGLDYVEVGPPGWEHIVVLVSDRPLVNAGALAKSSVAAPFVKLAARDVTALCDSLSNCPADTWSAGVLSFLVE